MKATIEQAVKSVVPEGTTYGKLHEMAVNAINAADDAGTPDRYEELFTKRLKQKGLDEKVSTALFAIVIHHARMSTQPDNGGKDNTDGKEG